MTMTQMAPDQMAPGLPTAGAASRHTPMAKPVPQEVTIAPARVAGWLWGATALVVALGVFREIYVASFGIDTALRDLGQIALDAEATVAAWYSSALMIAVAALLACIAVLTRAAGKRHGLHWTVLAIVFLAMSIDETASFHEVAIRPLRDFFDLSGALYFSWVVIAVPAVLALALAYLPFLLALPTRFALWFAGAGAVYVAGALGLEFAGGYFISTYGDGSLAYTLEFVAEETLEMIGLTIFLTGLLAFVLERFPGARLRLA